MFSDIPSSTLTLGSSLNASNIKEGDDVYFECAVQASPAPYKFTWRHNVSSINIYVDSINMQESSLLLLVILSNYIPTFHTNRDESFPIMLQKG